MIKKINLVLLLCVAGMYSWAQPENWYNLDPEDDSVPGVSAERLYERLLKDKEGETVIVAVLDSGVDPDHEDLASVMWVNEDEIPNNGIDDDKNGYVDDIHGWNFIGGKDGKNITNESLELTRLYAKLHPMYKDAKREKLSKKKREEYDLYLKVKTELEENREKFADAARIEPFIKAIDKLKALIGKDEITQEDVENFETDEPSLAKAVAVVANLMGQGSSFGEIEEQLHAQYDYYNARYNYYYNPEFDPRAEIVGDDYSDSYDGDYGNNDVEGPDAFHGTAVAGTIAADRTNDVGVKGVAVNVQIMSVRCVPDGDERDKDVANAIRYAVDNGASIINMSFGKGYVWDKKAVDKAVKYAAKKDVLLVHASGNDGKENFLTNNYPNDTYAKKPLFGKQQPNNWLEVGALSWKPAADIAATFSNYSKEHVDIFAPGVDMKLPTPNDTYRSVNGTSFAAPVVSGVAALLRSYFPALTAEQIKDVIMASSIRPKGEVKEPGSGEMVKFSSLSVSGGMINAFNAVMAASKMKGKKRTNKKAIAIP